MRPLAGSFGDRGGGAEFFRHEGLMKMSEKGKPIAIPTRWRGRGTSWPVQREVSHGLPLVPGRPGVTLSAPWQREGVVVA